LRKTIENENETNNFIALVRLTLSVTEHIDVLVYFSIPRHLEGGNYGMMGLAVCR